MGREVKRVALDFDWPIGQIWPPYMVRLCTEDVRYATGEPEDTNEGTEKTCKACRHAAKLAGVSIASHGCPNWKINPLPGDGYQLWETVSEGSPASPVFGTPEKLSQWLVTPGNDTSVTKGTTYEQWLAMIRGPGYAPTLICDAKGVRPGVQI